MTVKHRAGWDESSLNAPEFARALVEAGAAMITVHGRTRTQGFSGAARIEPIAAVRAALPRDIPVVGNGDVKDVAGYAAHEARDRLRRGHDRPRRDGQPVAVRALAALEQAPARSRARRRWPSGARSGAATRRWSSSTAPRRCACTSCARRWPGTRAACTAARRCASAASAVGDPRALLDMGEAFFADLEALARAGTGDGALATTPADPIAKSVARNGRRDGRKPRPKNRAPQPSVTAPVRISSFPARAGRGLRVRRRRLPLLVAVSRSPARASPTATSATRSTSSCAATIQLVAPATERLARYRRAAIPQIETAMHTAAPNGRLHLVAALDRIGDEEAVPVLRHLAVYDITAEVREAAEGLLTRWADVVRQQARAPRPRRAGRDRAQARRRDRPADFW